MGYQGGHIDGEAGEQTREVPPSSREGAGPNGRAQVAELEGGEEDVVRERADPVIGEFFLLKRHGKIRANQERSFGEKLCELRTTKTKRCTHVRID